MTFNLYSSASALDIVPSFPPEVTSISSTGSLPGRDEVSAVNIASRIISRCWGAMAVAGGDGVRWVD